MLCHKSKAFWIEEYRFAWLCFFLAWWKNIVAAKEGFEHFGSWSNVEITKSEDPHATGFELTLWRYQGKLLGYLSQYVGPIADPPIGEVENLILDEKSPRVSFTAKMSIGLVYSEEEKKYKNYQEWKQFYAGILKSRGPKW